MQQSSIKKWALNEEEVGFYTGPSNISSTSHTFKVYIPKLLPLMKLENATDTSFVLSKACFINSSECSVDTLSKVKLQNYINVKLQSNVDFSKPILNSMSKVRVKIINKSPDMIYLTNFEDESSYPQHYSMTGDE